MAKRIRPKAIKIKIPAHHLHIREAQIRGSASPHGACMHSRLLRFWIDQPDLVLDFLWALGRTSNTQLLNFELLKYTIMATSFAWHVADAPSVIRPKT